MSKQSQRHRMMVPRLVGYTTPLTVFIFLALWFRPQNEIGWAAVCAGAALSLVVSFATLTQARSEASNKKGHSREAESFSTMEERPLEARFVGTYGGLRGSQQDMGFWLRSQP